MSADRAKLRPKTAVRGETEWRLIGRKEKSANASSSPGDLHVTDIWDFAGSAHFAMRERADDHAHGLVARLQCSPENSRFAGDKASPAAALDDNAPAH